MPVENLEKKFYFGKKNGTSYKYYDFYCQYLGDLPNHFEILDYIFIIPNFCFTGIEVFLEIKLEDTTKINNNEINDFYKWNFLYYTKVEYLNYDIDSYYTDIRKNDKNIFLNFYSKKVDEWIEYKYTLDIESKIGLLSYYNRNDRNNNKTIQFTFDYIPSNQQYNSLIKIIGRYIDALNKFDTIFFGIQFLDKLYEKYSDKIEDLCNFEMLIRKKQSDLLYEYLTYKLIELKDFNYNDFIPSNFKWETNNSPCYIYNSILDVCIKTLSLNSKKPDWVEEKITSLVNKYPKTIQNFIINVILNSDLYYNEQDNIQKLINKACISFYRNESFCFYETIYNLIQEKYYPIEILELHRVFFINNSFIDYEVEHEDPEDANITPEIEKNILSKLLSFSDSKRIKILDYNDNIPFGLYKGLKVIDIISEYNYFFWVAKSVNQICFEQHVMHFLEIMANALSHGSKISIEQKYHVYKNINLIKYFSRKRYLYSNLRHKR